MAFPLSDAEQQLLADFSTAYARARGLLVADSGAAAATMRPVSVSLLPAAVPAAELRKVLDLQPLYNALVDRVARDEAWITATLAPTKGADDFVRRLLHVYEATPEDLAERPMLGIHRSDYMLHDPPRQGGASGALAGATARAKQVELNTISSSFGGLSAVVSGMHQAAQRRFARDPAMAGLAATLAANAASALGTAPGWGEGDAAGRPSGASMKVPDNMALKGLALGLASAHSHYVETAGEAPAAPPIVVFAVQEGERNVNDQRLLELELTAEYGISVVRATLAELRRRLRLVDSPAGARPTLVLLPPDAAEMKPSAQFLRPAGEAAVGAATAREVSVVYYRSGYDPEDYTRDDRGVLDLGATKSGDVQGLLWEARLLMEKSRAIQCPSVAYQLAGTKKVQQALALPGALEAFTATAADAAALRETFAGLWPLGEDAPAEETAAAIAEAKAHPDDFVVKPQREGGGHNYFGREVAEALESMSQAELSAHILMQRLRPRAQAMPLMKKTTDADKENLPSGADALRYGVDAGAALHELGIFGQYLGTGAAAPPKLNAGGGFILRAKPVDVDEGGVAAGYACLSSPILVGSGDELHAAETSINAAAAAAATEAVRLQQQLRQRFCW